MPALTITEDNWYDAADALAHDSTTVTFPVAYAFSIYSLCPVHVISPMSQMLVQMYSALDGFGHIASPQDYMKLPALWVDAVTVIRDELRYCDQLKEWQRAK